MCYNAHQISNFQCNNKKSILCIFKHKMLIKILAFKRKKMFYVQKAFKSRINSNAFRIKTLYFLLIAHCLL